jgi:hypothetical protein
MSKGPTKQHFVPKCYLKAFADPNTPDGHEPYVWLFDKDGKNGRKKGISNTFTETHLYTINLENGGKSFHIENKLSAIEGKFADIFKKKIQPKKPLSAYDHVYLCVFIAAQLQRTLRFKRNQENFIQQLIDHGKQMAMVHGVVSKQVQEWEEYKKDIHKIELAEGVPYLANILIKMNIAFLCAKDPVKHWFITSDDPCVLFNPDLQWQKFYSPGFGQKNIQLTLALSPAITVMFTWANYHGYSYAPAKNVEDLNRMTRSHADKEFISPYPKKKFIWFSRVPMDPFFIMKVLRKKTSTYLMGLKAKIEYRKIYARRKK